jgi:hypothetical protein
MANMVATRPITLLGKEYKAGQPVPWEKLNDQLQKALVKTRRVTEQKGKA